MANEEASNGPILRLETGMHTAAIRCLAVDAAGRWLVTGSDDHTVRLWDLGDRTLRRTLRPHLGPQATRGITAVAISPDGRVVAAAAMGVYLFDRESGQMLRTFALPEESNVGRDAGSPVARIAFSRDGSRLYAQYGLYAFRVLQVLEVDGGAVLFRSDSGSSQEPSRTFDVHPGGSLATVHQSRVQLYDDRLAHIRSLDTGGRMMFPGDEVLHAVRFSPDGGRLAASTAHGEILIAPVGDDGTSPTPTPVSNDVIPFGQCQELLAWSSDGQTLFTARGVERNRDDPPPAVHLLFPGGPAAGMSTSLPSEALDLAALPSGGVVFGCLDASWGVLSGDGTLSYRQSPPEFGVDDSDLLVDRSGAWVAFSERGRRSGVVFSLPDRELTVSGPDEHLSAADRSGREYISRPEGHASWTLGRFGGWTTVLPAKVVALNRSGDQRLVVVALGDGTLRWYRDSNGKELLALLPDADGKRWVLWTPSGYYDASVGGEDLIGWHVNRGEDQAADFFPASRFRAQFHRPDVIDRVLVAGDEAKALAAADAAAGRVTRAVPLETIAPPVVRILAPDNDSVIAGSPLEVRVAIRAAASVTGLRVLVNGRPASAARGLTVSASPPQPGEETRTLSIPIPRAEQIRGNLCNVVVMARTASSSNSVPAIVQLHWEKDEPPPLPALRLLAVGVSAYKKAKLALKYPAKDARDFLEAFRRQEGRCYRTVEMRQLLDGEATRRQILDQLRWFSAGGDGDTAVLFLAGHGTATAAGDYYFVPWDGDDEAGGSDTLLPAAEIQRALAATPGQRLLFLDTCHAGQVMAGYGARAAALDGVINQLISPEDSVVVFAASTGRQESREDSRWDNGAFTKAVVEALRGERQADFDHSGRITIAKLAYYVGRRVPQLTGDDAQTPTTAQPLAVPDFTIANV